MYNNNSNKTLNNSVDHNDNKLIVPNKRIKLINSNNIMKLNGTQNKSQIQNQLHFNYLTETKNSILNNNNKGINMVPVRNAWDNSHVDSNIHDNISNTNVLNNYAIMLNAHLLPPSTQSQPIALNPYSSFNSNNNRLPSPLINHIPGFNKINNMSHDPRKFAWKWTSPQASASRRLNVIHVDPRTSPVVTSTRRITKSVKALPSLIRPIAVKLRKPVMAIATDDLKKKTKRRRSIGPRLKRVSNACSRCKQSKTKCDNARPCSRCVRLFRADTCIDSVHKKRGRKRTLDQCINNHNNNDTTDTDDDDDNDNNDDNDALILLRQMAVQQQLTNNY